MRNLLKAVYIDMAFKGFDFFSVKLLLSIGKVEIPLNKQNFYFVYLI